MMESTADGIKSELSITLPCLMVTPDNEVVLFSSPHRDGIVVGYCGDKMDNQGEPGDETEYEMHECSYYKGKVVLEQY